MFCVLLDTSVWLDLAQDQKQTGLLDVLATMQANGYIELLVSDIVVREFNKNRQRVAERAQRSLNSHFSLVKDAIRQSGGNQAQKKRVLNYLSDVNHRIPLIGGAAVGTLDRIEALLQKATPLATSDSAKLKATDRALNRQAPCHHENKNSVADAILIETYFDRVRRGKAGERFAFVTHNKHDFSDPAGNARIVHPDLAQGFSKIKSRYFVALTDCLRRIDPVLMQEVVWENSYQQDVRSLSEIIGAMETLETQIWHNRHKNLAWLIEHGKHKIVSRAEWEKGLKRQKGYGQTHTIDTVWEGALKAARKAEKKLGAGNHGPWSDFEWGMLNGKLSALRWALGDEWDMLDT